jgi:hypothetical protein
MSNLMLLENPYNPWFERKVKDTRFRYFAPKHSKAAKKGRRNPIMKASISKYTGGVDATDIIGGALGLIAASTIPGMIVKTTTTTGQKLLKLACAAGITVGLGYAAKKFAPQAAKGLVIGGLAGTAVQGASMIPGMPSLGGIRQIGAAPNAPIIYPNTNYPNHGPANIGQTTKPEFSGIPNL